MIENFRKDRLLKEKVDYAIKFLAVNPGATGPAKRADCPRGLDGFVYFGALVYFGSTGPPASFQAFHPPLSARTRVNPLERSACAAFTAPPSVEQAQ